MYFNYDRMPFVMLCGLPSSGKTHYCNLLVDHFKNTFNKNAHVINDALFCTDKNAVYKGISVKSLNQLDLLLKD